MGNHKQKAAYHLHSLKILEKNEHSISSMTAQLPQNQNNNVILQSLLKTYQDFFQEPKGFPPSKAHGHVIPLKQWSQAVNPMAYRYLRLQKDVLKNIVMEMLEAGTIKPSTNPFTSLVILVKKKKLNLQSFEQAHYKRQIPYYDGRRIVRRTNGYSCVL